MGCLDQYIGLWCLKFYFDTIQNLSRFQMLVMYIFLYHPVDRNTVLVVTVLVSSSYHPSLVLAIAKFFLLPHPPSSNCVSPSHIYPNPSQSLICAPQFWRNFGWQQPIRIEQSIRILRSLMSRSSCSCFTSFCQMLFLSKVVMDVQQQLFSA